MATCSQLGKLFAGGRNIRDRRSAVDLFSSHKKSKISFDHVQKYFSEWIPLNTLQYWKQALADLGQKGWYISNDILQRTSCVRRQMDWMSQRLCRMKCECKDIREGLRIEIKSFVAELIELYSILHRWLLVIKISKFE